MPKIKTEKSNWHTVSAKQVLKELGSSKEGLSLEEAKKRYKEFGPNRLPQPKRFTRLSLFLSQFKSPLVFILVFAGIITIVLKEYLDAVVVWIATILDVAIGFFQENKASKALDRLREAIHFKTRVVRKGHYQEIDVQDLVAGDIVVLKPGDKVPADGRILESVNLEINEAPLTGEWIAAQKREQTFPPSTPLADRDNMVYQGTSVVGGSGRAIVVATGENTELGKIASLVREEGKEESPLAQKIARFAGILGVIFILISLAIFGIGWYLGMPFVEVLTLAAALAVSAVPEGLPVGVTVILALGMKRILKKRGLVRKLAAAETLGSTSVICADKTGTLTEAKMKVAQVLSPNKRLALKIAMLASEAVIENPEKPIQDWIVRGGPTDKALLLGGVRAGLDYVVQNKRHPLIQDLPFNQDNKYLATLRRFRKDSILYVSGAPEVLLDISNRIYRRSGIKRLNKNRRKKLAGGYTDLARQGFRMIAVAYRKFRSLPQYDSKKQSLETYCQNLIFVGFIALEDPLRVDAKETIKICQRAGLRPIIVTGDHKLTAKHIARRLDLFCAEENILEGKDLDRMSDEELNSQVKDICIYARVSPKGKLRIIEAWQDQGEIVAMTGDGVNDAPALTQADIGVALGSGTDVAKETADLVLLDDNFRVIVAAVKEGRAIFDNIKKVVVYLLSGSFEEIVFVAASFLFGLPLPLLPIQILWINLVEDGLPDMALAFEPPEKEVMLEKPRQRHAPLLDREMKVLIFIIGLITDFILFGLFVWFLRLSLDISHIRTMIFVALSLDSLFYIFSCRSFRHPVWRINPLGNKYLVGAVVIGLLLLLASVYVPFLQVLLSTKALSLFEWFIVIGLAIIDLVLIEAVKFFFIIHKKDRIKKAQ